MKRFLFAAAMFALAGVVVSAQDPKPAPQPVPAAQPKAIPLGKAVQPGVGNPFVTIMPRVTAAKMSLLEEDFETFEAHRDVRRGYVKAAEVAVRLAEVGADRTIRQFDKGVVTREEAERAKLEVEAAKAQLEIRLAEMREIEVKIKFAKRRLDEAKAAVLPKPNPAAKAVDPVPQP